MAVIQKLRNSGAVVIVIIVALILFVVGDIVTGNNKLGFSSEDQDVIATIWDDKIRESEINPVAQAILVEESENEGFKFDEPTRKKIFDQAWQRLVRIKTYESQIKKAGIYISDEEFNEMLTGEHPLEAITGDPSFQTDGKYDPLKLKQIFDQAKTNTRLKTQVVKYVKELKDNALETRYAKYIGKCLYTPKNEKEYTYIVSNQGVTGKMVALNTSTVEEKNIKVTDADLEKYLEEHKEEYKQMYDSRDITYVVWNITPSPSDTAYALEQAMGAAKSMRQDAKPDTGQDGVSASMNRSAISNTDSFLLQYVWPSKIGEVFGPTYKEGKFKVYQKVEQTRDTNPIVRAAHILIPKTGDLPNKTKITDSIMAEAKGRELYNKVMGGADIAALAKDWSSDGSASKGGDLGWADPSGYVPEFKQFCLNAKKGQIGFVKTQFGYHVIKMLEDPEYTKIRYVERVFEISPGSETVKIVDEMSRKFRNQVTEGNTKSFETARDKMALTPRIKKDIKTDDKNLPGVDQLEDVKQVMFWLFDKGRKKNDVSDVFAFATRHMVVSITNLRTAGYAKVDDVRDKIEPLVRGELKAKVLSKKFNQALATCKTIEELARKTGGTIIPLESVKMGTNFVPQLFTEPRILGAMFGVKEKKLSKPVEGSSAVVVLWIDSKDKVEIPKTGLEANEMNDYANQPQFLSNRLQEIFRSAANINDFRYKFQWN